MNMQDKIVNIIRETDKRDFQIYDAADKIIGLISREHTKKQHDSILTLEAICKQYEDFLLRGEKSYENSVIIRDIHHNAYFALYGGYHLQIGIKSLCGNYIHTAYDADYERRYVKGWEVVETFTSREELELFTELNNEVAYKYFYGNGMTAYIADIHVEFKEGDVKHYQELYYVDEETGFVFEENTTFLGFDPENSREELGAYCDNETYVEKDHYGPGQDEEFYYQVQNGYEGLKERLEAGWVKNSLAKSYHRIELQITKLGEV